MNRNDKKRQIFSIIIVVVVVLAMVLPLFIRHI